MASETKADKAQRADEIAAMFARIPVELLETKCMELLNATRTVSMGRDRDVVTEPDNAIQAKVWQTCIEQGAGRAAAAPPPPKAPPKAAGGDPGKLKPRDA